ncbi:Carbonic anhydrase 2 [Durusdinium trenchii]|uniref:Carbonic anhydrase n=1 Tax=Durusdinium trenchii TaxID=1381693 RepID=A0ABP0JDZ8_9DINO
MSKCSFHIHPRCNWISSLTPLVSKVHSEGSVLGSLEFCIGALNTKLILILGHTNCGAIKGATKQLRASPRLAIGTSGSKPKLCCAQRACMSACLRFNSAGGRGRGHGTGVGALKRGGDAKAEAQLGSTATEAQLADESVKLNVFKSMDYLLDNSRVIGSKVRGPRAAWGVAESGLVLSGEVDLEGGIYDLDTGRVTWLGKSPYVQRRSAAIECILRVLACLSSRVAKWE